MKKIFKCFLLLIFMTPLAFIFASCGEEPFEPYLDIESSFESEYDFDIDRETNTITYTTAGHDKTMCFNPEEISFKFYTSKDEYVELEYTDGEVGEGQYTIAGSTWADFNLPGRYAITLKTTLFEDITYKIVCQKQVIPVPTFKYAELSRPGIQYKGEKIDVSSITYMDYHGYKEYWYYEPYTNKDTGEVGYIRTEVGDYKAYLYILKNQYYSTESGENFTYVDWSIIKRALPIPTLKEETYRGAAGFSEPTIQNSYEYSGWLNSINYCGLYSKSTGNYYKESVVYADTYTVGYQVVYPSRQCFLVDDGNGGKKEVDTVNVDWVIGRHAVLFNYVRIAGNTENYLTTYNGAEQTADIYLTVNGVKSKYDSTNHYYIAQLEVTGEKSAKNAGTYTMKIAPATDNFYIIYEGGKCYYGDEPFEVTWEIEKAKVYNIPTVQYEDGQHFTYTGDPIKPSVYVSSSQSGESYQIVYENSVKYSEEPYKFGIDLSEESKKNYEWADGSQGPKYEYTYYIDRRELNVNFLFDYINRPANQFSYRYSYPTTKLSNMWIDNASQKYIFASYENNEQSKIGDYTATMKLSYLHDDKESLKFYRWVGAETEYIELEDEYTINYSIHKNRILGYSEEDEPNWNKVMINTGSDNPTLFYSLCGADPIICGTRYEVCGTVETPANNITVGGNNIAIVYDFYHNESDQFVETTDVKLSLGGQYKLVAKELRYYYDKENYINPYENENFDIKPIANLEAIIETGKHPIAVAFDEGFLSKSQDFFKGVNGLYRCAWYHDITYPYEVYSIGEFPHFYFDYKRDEYSNAYYTERGQYIYNNLPLEIVYTFYDENKNVLDLEKNTPPMEEGTYYMTYTYVVKDTNNYFLLNNKVTDFYQFRLVKKPIKNPTNYPDYIGSTNYITWTEMLTVDDVKAKIMEKYGVEGKGEYVYVSDVSLTKTEPGTYKFVPTLQIRDEYKDLYDVGQKFVDQEIYDEFIYIINKQQLQPDNLITITQKNSSTVYTGEPINVYDHFDYEVDTKLLSKGFAFYNQDGRQVDKIIDAGTYTIEFHSMIRDYTHYTFAEKARVDIREMTLIVEPKEINVDDIYFAETNIEVVYDFQTHQPTLMYGDIELDASYIIRRDTNTCFEARDVGTYTFTVTNINGNYKANKVTSSKVATLTIVHREYDLSKLVWECSEFYYDGSEKTVKLADELDLEIKYTYNTFTNVGTYTATAEVGGVHPLDENIILTGEIPDLHWSIKKTDVDIATLAWDYTGPFTYDGNAKTVKVVQDYGIIFSYTDARMTDAGTYTAVATAGCELANPNYNYIGTTCTLSWTIDKQTVTLKDCEWDYQEAFVYNGTQQSVVLSGEYTFEYQNNKATDAGSYTATATLVDARIGNENYTIVGKTSYTLNWTIEKYVIDPDDLEFNYPKKGTNIKVSYNGEEIEILPTNIPEFVEYSIEGNKMNRPGESYMKITIDTTNVIFDNYKPEQYGEWWYVEKGIIDISNIKLEQYYIEFVRDGRESYAQLDMDSVPEVVDVEILSNSSYPYLGANYYRMNVKLKNTDLYILKYKFNTDSSANGIDVELEYFLYPTKEDMNYWIDGFNGTITGGKQEFVYDEEGIELRLYGDVLYALANDGYKFIATDSEGNRYDLSEKPCLEIGVYTLHVELTPICEGVDLIEIPDSQFEVVAPSFNYWEYATLKYRDEDGNVFEAGHGWTTVEYTGKTYEFFLEINQEVAEDIAIEYISNFQVKEQGYYELRAKINVTGSQFRNETLDYIINVEVFVFPFTELKIISEDGSETPVEFSKDSNIVLVEINDDQTIAIKVKNGFDVYLVEQGDYSNKEKLQPSGGWCYAKSNSSYMTLIIMQGVQELYYINVEINQTGSGGVIVFPMG